jgi:hypothetical protein
MMSKSAQFNEINPGESKHLLKKKGMVVILFFVTDYFLPEGCQPLNYLFLLETTVLRLATFCLTFFRLK